MASFSTVLAATAAVLGLNEQAEQGRKAEAASSRAAAQATQQAKDTATRADQETNRVNQKKPDVNGIIASNQQAAKGGGGGTMLTGPTGVDMSSVQLGKTTLLGG